MTEQSKSGYVLVPVEPTREMWAAGADAVVGKTILHHDIIVEAVYRAMIDAAPPIPVDDDRLREIRERWSAGGPPFVKADINFLADTIASLQARVVELEGILHRVAEAVEPPLDEHGVWAGTVAEAVAATVNRAEAAEAERDRRGELLREAQNELNIIGSYAYDPETPLGLRTTAEAYNRLITRIDAALKDTTHDR